MILSHNMTIVYDVIIHMNSVLFIEKLKVTMFTYKLRLHYILFCILFSLFTSTFAENKNIVFCWSPNDHPKDTHGYKVFAERMTEKFKAVNDIKTTSVQGFPKAKVWKEADLVVFFLTIREFSSEQLALLDKHIVNGKSLLFLHQGLVTRKGYNELAERIGFAFSWAKGPEKSKWGKFNNPISLKIEHDIFKGFPTTITFDDELYWNLKKGSKGKVTVLGVTKAPKGEKGNWPVFWTVEHKKGGRVFCAVPGHFDKVRQSQTFDKITMRGISWCLSKPIE